MPTEIGFPLKSVIQRDIFFSFWIFFSHMSNLDILICYKIMKRTGIGNFCAGMNVMNDSYQEAFPK